MSETLSPSRALAERIDPENAITLTELNPHPESWERTTCRACLSRDLLEVLSLGNQPPANSFVKTADLKQPEARYPLSLRLCESCGMVQLRHVVPPELLYRSYLFFTSSSQWMADHFSKLMTDNAAEFVPPGGLVVEIGSNDGTALSAIHRRDVRLLGIDPARNISVMAASRGVPTIAEFFNETLAAEVARVAGQAHLIVACNVMGHIDNLDQARFDTGQTRTARPRHASTDPAPFGVCRTKPRCAAVAGLEPCGRNHRSRTRFPRKWRAILNPALGNARVMRALSATDEMNEIDVKNGTNERRLTEVQCVASFPGVPSIPLPPTAPRTYFAAATTGLPFVGFSTNIPSGGSDSLTLCG